MSYITINQDYFQHNVEIIKKHLQTISPNKNIQIGAVLKDNAYGHGLDIMSDLASAQGIKTAFVKNYDEAIRIAHKFESVSIFYGTLRQKIPNIYLSVYDFSDIEKLEKSIGDVSDTCVELKVNVGMNRNGIDSNDLEKIIEKILKKQMNLKGVFSHNGYGDDCDEEFYRQIEKFDEIKYKVKNLSSKLGFELPRFHSLNSSSALRVKESDDCLVRIGIALYGYLSSDIEIECASHLKPILKLYANKISTKTLHKGDRIGYGGITKISHTTKVSTYDIGYGDGLYRLNGNKKLFLPNGNEILPKTSMDCFSSYGDFDEVCVIDDASYIARIFDTIPYEVLTRLSPYIKRLIIKE